MMSPEVDEVVYRLASGALAAEGIAAVAMIGITWAFRPDFIKSRAVVIGVMLTSAFIGFDRGLAALGFPLGSIGLAILATLGAATMAAAAYYHKALGEVPDQAAFEAVEAEKQRLAADVERSEAALEAVSEQLKITEEMVNIRTTLDAHLDGLKTLRRTAATSNGWMKRRSVIRELLEVTPMVYLAWDHDGQLELVEGRDVRSDFVDHGRVHLGQKVAEAYKGSPVVQYVDDTLLGKRFTRLFEDTRTKGLWAAHYWPRDGGGAVVALPITRAEFEEFDDGRE
jgi:hypothetical protein